MKEDYQNCKSLHFLLFLAGRPNGRGLPAADNVD